MKKFSLFIIGLFFCASANVACAAVAVKKAASVSTAKQAPVESVGSLLPNVIQMVQTVQQITKAQKELTAECVPTAQERTFVDNTMKEYAKTGAATAEEIMNLIGKDVKCCDGGKTYDKSAQQAAEVEMPALVCYDCFNQNTDKGTIWENYPKVGIASYCSDGSPTCKNKTTVSNIYDIFNTIDFAEADYTAQESAMAAKLIAKIENCSTAKLSAKKRAMWGEFVTGAISNVGKPTNTGNVLDSVGGILSGGGLQSIGGIATQLLDR